jgi:Uma2 family endonuclease
VNPQAIVEVLSDLTELNDRGEQWSAYRTIPTLTDYLIVASSRRAVDHYHRVPDRSWTLRELQRSGTATLGNGVVLDLDSVYRRVPGLDG